MPWPPAAGDAEAAVLEEAVSEEVLGSATPLAVSQAGGRFQAAVAATSQAAVAATSLGEETSAADISMEGRASLLDSMAVLITTALHIIRIMDTALATVVAITTSGVTGFRVLTATRTDVRLLGPFVTGQR